MKKGGDGTETHLPEENNQQETENITPQLYREKKGGLLKCANKAV